jgi:Family of unknown function (DUF5947)
MEVKFSNPSVPAMNTGQPGHESGFGLLRQFIRRKGNAERCELCSAEVAAEHQHLIEPGSRKLICACDACAILFGGMSTKYKRVPRRVVLLDDFHMSDGQWEGLMVPIGMAFFFRSTPRGRIDAFYPSPAGATESLLSLEAWTEIEKENPALKEMEADVEALLVNRISGTRHAATPEYYIVPIDQCYKLVGLIRAHWKGLSGGAEVWGHIESFFATLKQQANPTREEANA